MKSMTLIIHTFLFSALILLASCGADMNAARKTSGSSSEGVTGGNCACDLSYSPVCGLANGNYKTYDNKCVATCFKVTQISPGNCSCKDESVGAVCGDDGKTYASECKALAAISTGSGITSIVKYADCAAASY